MPPRRVLRCFGSFLFSSSSSDWKKLYHQIECSCDLPKFKCLYPQVTSEARAPGSKVCSWFLVTFQNFILSARTVDLLQEVVAELQYNKLVPRGEHCLQYESFRGSLKEEYISRALVCLCSRHKQGVSKFFAFFWVRIICNRARNVRMQDSPSARSRLFTAWKEALCL
ncbi:hypothetical protein NDU88_000273 [Pleurodeles waltl]|uniref:Uncharacterized protein n=1 Tax=Pleurodeles waltl TaxID=8319 RepID=A0AAV7KLT1_PLEWA|nr:hypothetical protein NDU88_000273 [Pleurodeles waltl]